MSHQSWSGRGLILRIWIVLVIMVLLHICMTFINVSKPGLQIFTLKIVGSRSQNQDEETMNTFAMRKKLYQEGCKYVTKVHKEAIEILVNDQYKLAYCPLPKAGKTFWVRVFRFISRDVGDSVKVRSFYDVDRRFAHFEKWKVNPVLKYIPGKENNQTLHNLKFMVTRDPYRRLLSAYIDKILLPDFWFTHGRAIVKQRKKNKTAGSNKDVECPGDISFKEFLAYAVRTWDEHWIPATRTCAPCSFQPHLIVHLESFSRDSNFILKKANLSHLIEDDKQKTHVESEVRSITNYNYKLLKYKHYLKCLPFKRLAKKLWSAFKLNGHIRKNAIFPDDEIDEGMSKNLFNVSKHITKVFINQVRKDPLTEEESKYQKEAELRREYGDVPRNLITKVQEIFEEDFILFGYDTKPPA
ncbi:hypothetical protein RRG08_004750 [Elysia crispata]|uniref:Carbohydrate sulfotransferase n=1 Tax=Elysia crispata TaxID=231223 RepID=A0AAE1AJ56_9GAST|nr:hypothetical protein RRG08_004750 [Elysia crispata]